MKHKFEGLIKNVWSFNTKVLKIMYKTKVDVCFATYNFKFTNYYSKKYHSSHRSSSCMSSNYVPMKKTYLRKAIKEQFFSYIFIPIFKVTSTSMLLILRWHLCKLLTLIWNHPNTPKNCLASKITFGSLLACSFHQVRHLTTSFSKTRKSWKINTL